MFSSSIFQSVLLPTSLFAMLASHGAAQTGVWEETWREHGDLFTYGFGGFVASLGDVDGDLVPEFAVCAPFSQDPYGRVFLYSGATGQLNYSLSGTRSNSGFGSSILSVADQDGDGFRDLLIGAPHWDFPGYFASGVICLYSGKSGTLLRMLDGLAYAALAFGQGLAHAGDLDQDGMEDFLVDTAASLLAISGRHGDFLWGWYPSYHFGGPDASFATLGTDVNGDGIHDVVVGDFWWQQIAGGLHAGIVRLLSGKDGSAIWTSAPGTVGSLGWNLAIVGDIDGDAIPDILAGEPGDVFTGVPGPSRALLLSGINGSLIRAHDSSPNGEWMGMEVSALGGSWDSDEVPDYVVGTHWYSNPSLGFYYEGRVDVYSGSDGQSLVTFFGTEPAGMFGVRTVSVGDLDGDGFPEMLVGAPLEDHPSGPPDVGGAHMFSFRPLLTVNPPVLSLAAGTPSAAALDFPLQEAAWPYAVLASATGIGPTVIGGVEVPLSADPLLARMVGGWTPPLLLNGQGILDAQGDATALIHPSPGLAAYLGRTFWIAAVSWDPGWGQVRLSSVARPLTVVP